MRDRDIASQFALRHQPAARAALLALWLAAVLLLAGSELFAAPDARPTQQAAAVVVAKPAPWVSLNPTFRSLATAQGVSIGSPLWLSGGDGLLPSDTGGHASYGWRLDYLLTQAWVRAVVSNYAARPAYYDAAPMRQSGYFIGCRPVGWGPESEVYAALDPAHVGAQVVAGLDVGGYDLEHFAVAPLVAVAWSHGFTVNKLGVGDVPADKAARTMLRYLLAAQAGMLRDKAGAPVGYVCRDRPARYVCGNLAAGVELDAVAPADAALLYDYVRLRLVPHWLAPPDNDPAKGGDLQVYNGVSWAVPALYDLVLVTPPGKLRVALWSALQAQCQRLALLAALVPGKACQVTTVDTWTGLTAAGVHTEAGLGAWGVRAQLVAGAVLGLPACTAEGMTEAAKWKSDPDARRWLVAPDGSYLFGAGQ